jgi:hypothetical protein
MSPATRGDLVTVADGSAELDGIVVDAPSSSKVVVAVVDRTRGPRLRTVHPSALSERPDEGPNDRALRLLIRRSAPPIHDATRTATRGAQRRSGYQRGTAHRPTGR